MYGKQIVTFTAMIDRVIADKPNWKMYAVTPIDQDGCADDGSMLTYNRYGNVSITGDMQEVAEGASEEYKIKAEYCPPRKSGGREYDASYKVISMRRDRPVGIVATTKFLSGLLTERQADTLLSSYPNIMDIIKNDNDLSKDKKTIILDLSQMKGIKEITYRKIRNKIVHNFDLQEIIAEFHDYDLTFGNIKSMYVAFGSAELIREKMRKAPYDCLCQIAGIGFKKADKIILSSPANEHMRNSKQRAAAAIKFVLLGNEGGAGNTYMEFQALHSECYGLVPECMAEHFMPALTVDWINVNPVLRRIATEKAYQAEKYVANALMYMVKTSHVWDLAWMNFIDLGEFTLSEEQQQTPQLVCKNAVTLLKGFAGAGKSASMQCIINMCDHYNLRYSLLAPTGRASQVLAEYTGRDASTIHRGLGYNPSQGWQYNEENKFPFDILIIDEVSMVDIFLMQTIMASVDTDKTKILFVQDPAQIPSVGCGNVSYDMIESNCIPTAELTTIFRYGEGGVLTVATKIRNGEKYLPSDFQGIEAFGAKEDYMFISTVPENIIERAVNVYEKLLRDGVEKSDIMVLVAQNIGDYGTVEINKRIQEAINPKQDGKDEVQFGQKTFRVGDRVMQIRNNYQASTDSGDATSIFNGDIGTITRINVKQKYMYVKYKNKIIMYDSDEYDQIVLGYCITMHKSQGSGSNYVILLTPSSHTFMLNRNLLYTALTRTKIQCYHLGEMKTVNTAIKKSINLKRQTNLILMLKDLEPLTREQISEDATNIFSSLYANDTESRIARENTDKREQVKEYVKEEAVSILNGDGSTFDEDEMFKEAAEAADPNNYNLEEDDSWKPTDEFIPVEKNATIIIPSISEYF